MIANQLKRHHSRLLSRDSITLLLVIMYHYDPTNALTRRRPGLRYRDGKGVLNMVLVIAYSGQ